MEDGKTSRKLSKPNGRTNSEFIESAIIINKIYKGGATPRHITKLKPQRISEDF